MGPIYRSLLISCCWLSQSRLQIPSKSLDIPSRHNQQPSTNTWGIYLFWEGGRSWFGGATLKQTLVFQHISCNPKVWHLKALHQNRPNGHRKQQPLRFKPRHLSGLDRSRPTLKKPKSFASMGRPTGGGWVDGEGMDAVALKAIKFQSEEGPPRSSGYLGIGTMGWLEPMGFAIRT